MAERLKGGVKKKAAATATATEALVIEPLKIGKITLDVEGEMLIVHRFAEKARKEIRDKQQQIKHKQREKRDPQAEYEAAKYLDEDGNHCVPVIAFKNAMLGEARFLPRDVTMVLLKGALFVQGDRWTTCGMAAVPLRYKSERMREDMVRLSGIGRPADLRYRPEYRDWSCTLTIEFDTRVLSAQMVVNLLNASGFNCGVMEWRPEAGRFRVSLRGGKIQGEDRPGGRADLDTQPKELAA